MNSPVALLLIAPLLGAMALYLAIQFTTGIALTGDGSDAVVRSGRLGLLGLITAGVSLLLLKYLLFFGGLDPLILVYLVVSPAYLILLFALRRRNIHRLGGIHRAELIALRVLERDPANIARRLELGSAALQKLQYAQAERWFTAILKIEPNNRVACFRLAELYLETQRPAKVQGIIDQLADSKVNGPQVKALRERLEKLETSLRTDTGPLAERLRRPAPASASQTA